MSHLSILHNFREADNSFAPHSEGLLSRKCNSPVSLVFVLLSFRSYRKSGRVRDFGSSQCPDSRIVCALTFLHRLNYRQSSYPILELLKKEHVRAGKNDLNTGHDRLKDSRSHGKGRSGKNWHLPRLKQNSFKRPTYDTLLICGAFSNSSSSFCAPRVSFSLRFTSN